MKLPEIFPNFHPSNPFIVPSRITMERRLIVSAAALVVVLAVRGGQQSPNRRAADPTSTPDVSTQTIADASPDDLESDLYRLLV